VSTVTTWLEGRTQTVPDDDPRLAEREAHRIHCHHMANLRGLGTTHDRRAYLDNVERKQGRADADRLRADFRAEWERRNA